MSTQTDAKGQTITFAYEDLGRIESKIYSNVDPAIPNHDVFYYYDNQNTPYGIGRLDYVTNGDVNTQYGEYDPMGRVAGVTRTISGLSPQTTLFEYDLIGRQSYVTHPDNSRDGYTYMPGTGLLEYVFNANSPTEVYAECSNYDVTGKIGTITKGDGTETNYAYDPETLRLMGLETLAPGGGSSLQERYYQYSLAGDVIEIDDAVRNAPNGVIYSYTYDKLHRLKEESNTGPDAGIRHNLLRTGYSQDHIHAVSSLNFNGTDYNYAYDANGNMTTNWDFTDSSQAAQRTITYNADNMPVAIDHDKNGTHTYSNITYDGGSTRAKKVITGASTSTTYYVSSAYGRMGTSMLLCFT